tara:strand:- start:9650 stop:10621 length:972 start_codon:yes stop_codon:yes gene_type:complete
MEFFNKKEEVLDFQLTEYGKYLLTIGRLKPTYYAFFDDDIIYDTQAAGFKENQNETEPRIQSNTPSLKVIPTRTGAEQRVSSFVQQITDLVGPNTDVANDLEVFSQVEAFEDKGRLSAYPLGRSSLDSPYDAAWDIQLHSTPNLSSSTSYLNTGYTVVDGVRVYSSDLSGSLENIPQLNIDVDYKMYYADPQAITIYKPGETTFGIPGATLNLKIQNNYLLIEVVEQNTPFEKDNFDIEVFYAEPDGTHTQLAYSPTGSASFTPHKSMLNTLDIMGNVEYYMNILVDEDISDDTYKEWNIPTSRTNKASLVRDIYESDNEEPC